jgi:hypothetical protein
VLKLRFRGGGNNVTFNIISAIISAVGFLGGGNRSTLRNTKHKRYWNYMHNQVNSSICPPYNISVVISILPDIFQRKWKWNITMNLNQYTEMSMINVYNSKIKSYKKKERFNLKYNEKWHMNGPHHWMKMTLQN